MRVLVLGGCGFIGSHVVDAALRAGHEVRVLGRSPERFRPPLAGVDYRLADLADLHALPQALAGCDAVLHLITTCHPAEAERDPLADVEGNLVGTLHLLRSMLDTGVTRLLFLSSGGAVYGRPDSLPVAEKHLLRPISSYGIVKVAAESYIAAAARQGLVATVLRPSNAFGPRQSASGGSGFIASALTRLAQGQPIDIFGDGSVVRDYLPVTDLAELCLLALDRGAGLTLNAGSGIGRSLLQVTTAIERVTGRVPALRFQPGRAIDVPAIALDCRAAQDQLGWISATRFEDALAETWNWVRRQG